jgi:Mrp family chromosome partitioning ATPase
MSNFHFLHPDACYGHIGSRNAISGGVRGARMMRSAVRERAAEVTDVRCRILLISSPKGGSGKSVLSRHLLVIAAQAGIHAIGLDFDRQQTLAKWAARRIRTREAFPDFVNTIVEAVPLQDWRGALRRTIGYQLAIIDTPPSV